MTSMKSEMTDATPFENAELPENRAAIWPGVVALVFGIAAAMSLESQLFWFVAATGSVVSGFVIWRAQGKAGATIVRLLATLGMVASILFGTWGLSHHLTRSRYLEQQSVDFGREWIDLLQQRRIKEAHQLSIPPERRATDMVLMEDLYKSNAKMSESYRTFEASPLVKQITDLGQRGAVRYDGVENSEIMEGYDVIHQNYTITGIPGMNAKSISLTLSLRRLKPSAARTSHWEIANFRQREDR